VSTANRSSRPWTDADVEEAADLDHPMSPEVIDRIMPIVRAALARGGRESTSPSRPTKGAPRQGAPRNTPDRTQPESDQRGS
jgi:hypothetical protein